MESTEEKLIDSFCPLSGQEGVRSGGAPHRLLDYPDIHGAPPSKMTAEMVEGIVKFIEEKSTGTLEEMRRLVLEKNPDCISADLQLR